MQRTRNYYFSIGYLGYLRQRPILQSVSRWSTFDALRALFHGCYFQFILDHSNLDTSQSFHLKLSTNPSTIMDTSRWTENCCRTVRNVTIVGATHGNELHGIFLVKEVNSVAKSSELLRDFPSLRISGVIGNPAAVKAIGTGAGLRYCDTDLNRCFLLQDLADPNISSIEGRRAKELDLLLGPKCSPNPKSDLILDFHSTTSNTGILLCCHPQDKLSLQLIAHLQLKHPQLNASLWADSDVPLLPTIARSGITFEVGPISHSTSNAELYSKTKILLNETLHYLEIHNKWIMEGMPRARTVQAKAQIYRRFATVGFPRDSDGNSYDRLMDGLIDWFECMHCF